jgi:hypothetical protein
MGENFQGLKGKMNGQKGLQIDFRYNLLRHTKFEVLN